MTAARQLGSQIRAARLAAGLSLRKLGTIAGIPATTIEGYEAGASVPAEKLARIAGSLSRSKFNIDGYEFTVSRTDRKSTPQPVEQMLLDFTGEYNYAKAKVKIGPGKITILLDGTKTLSVGSRAISGPR